MAIFPSVYNIVFVPIQIDLAGNGSTADLLKGHLSFFNADTWKAIPTASATVGASPRILVAMGSNHSVDKIGTHGGYQESIKSKPIDGQLVHRFWKTKGRPAASQVITIGYDKVTAGTGPVFDKGKEYLLRIDLKGSPILRFLARNAYHTFDAKSGCIDVCADPCGPTAKVDPVLILLQWAKQIKEDPIFSDFVSPSVYYSTGNGVIQADETSYVEQTDEAVIPTISAGMEIAVAYMDTKFGNCSFDVRDHYELEPIEIIASIVDENGVPCKIPTLQVTETHAAQVADGTGEKLIRDLILFNRYRQEPYLKSNRRKEIEDVNAVTHDLVDRDSLYTNYYLLHSVPRHSNPSSTVDADQYLIQIAVKNGTDMTAFELWMKTYLDSAGRGVKLEDLSLSES